MEAGEFGTVRDLAFAVKLSKRQVSRQMRLAFLAPAVLKRLVYRPAVTLLDLIDIASWLPWVEQEGAIFNATSPASWTGWAGIETTSTKCIAVHVNVAFTMFRYC